MRCTKRSFFSIEQTCASHAPQATILTAQLLCSVREQAFSLRAAHSAGGFYITGGNFLRNKKAPDQKIKSFRGVNQI